MPRIPPLVLIPVAVLAAFIGLALGGMFTPGRDELPSTREGGTAPAMEPLTALGDRPMLTRAMLDEPGVKIVNYWASWCAPCRLEHPQISALAEEFPVYGINYKDTPEKALAFLDDLGDPYAAIGQDAGRVAMDWGVYGVPETYVIDGDGTVVMRFAGPITAELLEKRIRPAIETATGKSGG